MKKVTVSFSWEGKTVSLESSLDQGEKFKVVARGLLEESLALTNPGTATGGQFRAFWAHARQVNLSREQARELLEQKFGSARSLDIIGKVPSADFSNLIDSLSEGEEAGDQVTEAPGMVTSEQLRAFWGQALSRGWDRKKVREFLADQLGESRDSRIVGKVPAERFEQVLAQLAA